MSSKAQLKSQEQAAKGRPKSRPTDARIRRTHERLGHALLELMRDRGIRNVTVQDVLDRAEVGRSTFYVHFRDKNDLLLSQLEGFLEIMSTSLSARKEVSHRVAPIAEMFSHVGSQKELYRSIAEAGALDDFFGLAQDYFTRGIAERFTRMGAFANCPPEVLRVHAVAAAGSLLALFRWWKESPAQLDKIYHQMIWHGLGASGK